MIFLSSFLGMNERGIDLGAGGESVSQYYVTHYTSKGEKSKEWKFEDVELHRLVLQKAVPN